MEIWFSGTSAAAICREVEECLSFVTDPYFRMEWKFLKVVNGSKYYITYIQSIFYRSTNLETTALVPLLAREDPPNLEVVSQMCSGFRRYLYICPKE